MFAGLTAQEVENRMYALECAYGEEAAEIVRRNNPSEAERLAFLWREVDVLHATRFHYGTDNLYTLEQRLAQAKQLLN